MHKFKPIYAGSPCYCCIVFHFEGSYHNWECILWKNYYRRNSKQFSVFFFWDPFFQSTWAYLILLHLIFLFHVYRQTFTHFRTAHTHILRKKKSDKQEEEGEKKLNLSFIDLSHKAIFTHPCCCQLATFAFRWPYCSHFYCFFPIFRFNCTYTYIFADCTQSIW